MSYQAAATMSRVGKAAKAAHSWCRECRKIGRSPFDPALGGELVWPTFRTRDEELVWEAVVRVLTERHEARKQMANSARSRAMAAKRSGNLVG